MKNIMACLILLVTLPAMAAIGPEQLIRQTSESVMAEIRANMDIYKSDPQKLYKLVDELVLPQFNFTAMADLALGRYKDSSLILRSEERITNIRRHGW